MSDTGCLEIQGASLHDEEIIISLFSAPAWRITSQGNNTTYSVISSRRKYYMLYLQEVVLCGGEEDP
ncbi:hypothetical protein FIL74_22680 [Escherichia coli]|nr:hypothetical protein [Escherichia coli]EFB2124209.1 hypothetical protein [Escherichia coli]MGK16894.1 hypothetical protein [Escherichia coli]